MIEEWFEAIFHFISKVIYGGCSTIEKKVRMDI